MVFEEFDATVSCGTRIGTRINVPTRKLSGVVVTYTGARILCLRYSANSSGRIALLIAYRRRHRDLRPILPSICRASQCIVPGFFDSAMPVKGTTMRVRFTIRPTPQTFFGIIVIRSRSPLPGHPWFGAIHRNKPETILDIFFAKAVD